MSPRRKEPDDSYDAIVIGGGLGGLSCALDLSLKGLRVVLFEQHSQVGGYAHNFKRRGYTFDVSLHHLGGLEQGQLANRVLGRFGVLERLELLRREKVFTARFPNLTVELTNGPEAVREQLGALFPAQKDGLDRLLPHLSELKHHVVDPWLVADFPVPPQERLSRDYLESTFGDVLRRYISDPALLAILGQLWFYVGLPPDRSTATFTTCVFCSSFCEGSYYIRGGGGALTRAMAHRLDELGGACFLRTPVAGIRVQGGVAVGVELASGLRVNAPRVISSANPYQTFSELVPPGATSAIYRHRLDQMTPSLSAYATYIGLDCPPARLGIPDGNYFHNHGLDLEAAYQRAMAGELEGTDWCLSNNSVDSPASYPSGGGIVSLVELTPEGAWLTLDKEQYRRKKQQAQRRLMKKYNDRFPGLADHAVVLELGTPRTMHRYTGNRGGALYGLAQTVEQSNAGRLRNRTPLGGLFLTGAWTWAGGGYEGALMSGIQTSAAVMRDMEASPSAPGPARAPAEPREVPRPGRDDQAMTHQLTVYGDDVDTGGRTSASAYLRFMDRGRVESIEEICRQGGDRSWLKQFMVNVYRIQAHFPGRSGPGDRLEVLTDLRRKSSHRASFFQRVSHAGSGQIVAEAQVEVLFLDADKNLAVVPEVIPTPGQDQQEAGGIELAPVPFARVEHFCQRHPFRVYYEDTDAQGITYHVSYVRFCERALSSLLRGLDGAAGKQAPRTRVSRLDIRYLHASSLGHGLEVLTGGRRGPSGRVVLDQRLVTSEEQTVVVDAMIELGSSDSATDQHKALLGICSPKEASAQPAACHKPTPGRPAPLPKKTGIGAFLLTPENLELVRKSSWRDGRARVIELGKRYFDRHPDEVSLLSANLASVGLPGHGADLDRALRHLIIHYYEKLFVLVKDYEGYWIAKNRIDFGQSLEPLEEARRTGKAVFMGQSHFGATYLMGLALMVRGFDLYTVGSFPGEVGETMRQSVDHIAQRYGTGRVHLLNIADPETDVPVEMMRRLSQGEIVSNVYDEANALCRSVKLLEATVRGGAGMDRILAAFDDDQVMVVTPFLVRTSEDSFRYELDRHRLADGDIVQSFYGSLERRVRAYPHQWYFAQEVHRSLVVPSGNGQG